MFPLEGTRHFGYVPLPGERQSVLDKDLIQLHSMKFDLLRSRLHLRCQLAALRSEEVNAYLRICYHRSEVDFVEAVALFVPIQKNIQCQRDLVLSELMEVRLMLDHVNDQIETFEAVVVA